MRTLPFLLLSLVALLALAGCPDDPVAPDAAALPTDAARPADTGGEGPDTGNLTPPDAGTSVDVGTPGDVGVLPTPDGGAEPADVGTSGPDAASGTPDTGVGPDAGDDTILGHARSPLFGSVIFNEVLTDGTTDGDPNGDGDANPVEDQFVELVNVSANPVAFAGFTLIDQDLPDLPRHTFGAFTLAPGKVAVVFGGGDAPDPTATTTFFAANAADPGLPFGLHLSEPADALLLLDTDQKVVAYFCYGGTGMCALQAASDESLTRSPDLTGAFVPHRTAAGSAGAAFSVGTKVDGSAF